MRMYLVAHGVPFDTAFAASDAWVLAAYVVLAEIEGNHFDWAKLEFIEKR